MARDINKKVHKTEQQSS